jgi:hypothetical protein
MLNPKLKSVPEDDTDPAAEATQTTAPAPDPFDDINSLRLSQAFEESSGVKKLLRTIPIRKPNKQEFVRVHPSPEYRGAFAVIVLKVGGDLFLLTPSIANALPREPVAMSLYTTINLQGVLTFWPIRLPSQDGRLDEWSRSATDAAGQAMKIWTRVVPNLSLGAYEQEVAEGNHPEPEWPDMPFQELLRIAFRDRLIDSLDHPVIRQLRGL